MAISPAPRSTVCRFWLARPTASDATLAWLEVSSEFAVICCRAAESSSLAPATRMAASAINWITSPRLFFMVFMAWHARPDLVFGIDLDIVDFEILSGNFLHQGRAFGRRRPIACVRCSGHGEANDDRANQETDHPVARRTNRRHRFFWANAAAARSSSSTSSCRILVAASKASPPADWASRLA